MGVCPRCGCSRRQHYRSVPSEGHARPFGASGILGLRNTEQAKVEGTSSAATPDLGTGVLRCCELASPGSLSPPCHTPCRVLTGQGEPPAPGEDQGQVCRGCSQCTCCGPAITAMGGEGRCSA